MRRSSAAFAALLLLAQGLLGATCVDGQTPDCSDPNVQCGPDLDGAAVDVAADAPADSASEAATDSGADASDAADEADAPADGSDAG